MRLRAAAALAAALALLPLAGLAAPAESFVDAGDGGVLKGTMLRPEGAPHAPMALIIPGSGPVDREGNSGALLKAASYRLLAEALAARGIGSVRIDKRGMYASAGAGDGNKVTFALYGRDVHAWASAIRARTGVPCVWVVGHSEGGLTALVAAQDPTDICGLVLISTAGRPTGELLRAQLHASPAAASLLPQIDPAIDTLEAGRHVETAELAPPLRRLFAEPVQDFLIDDFRQDPVALLKAYRGPVLVVQGDRDLQVSTEDAERLGHARAGVRLAILPGVNHALKAAPEDRAGNIATYADPALPLAPGVAEAVAGFIRR